MIVAEHASARFGGEAILPLHYFRFLRARGVECWLVVHERTREELRTAIAAADHDRVHYVPDRAIQRWLNKLGGRLPNRIRMLLVDLPIHFVTQIMQRRVVRDLVREHRIDVVHEPIPVSPKMPSFLHGVGAPVVIGPMNGGMSFPPAFRHMQSRIERWLVGLGRAASGLMNRLVPGKRRAALLLVANPRTRRALPPGLPGAVEEIVENGVDLGLWNEGRIAVGSRKTEGPVRFLFMGRMVDWKAVDILLHAVARLRERGFAGQLELLGDGRERPALERLTQQLGIGGAVTFHGFRPQAECAERLAACDALVLPSLYECGGAVVLEAMAMGKPVIATAWGGPADYVDDTCGILIAPASREAMVEGFAVAMGKIAGDRNLRESLGRAGRARVVAEYDWQIKIDRMLAIYRRVMASAAE